MSRGSQQRAARVAPEKQATNASLSAARLSIGVSALETFMVKSYSEKLKDPRWQRRRLEILSLSQFTCQECYSTEKTLHVHHLFYRKGADPWDYEDNQLKVLCEQCHQEHTKLDEALKPTLGQLSIDGKQRVLGYISAYALVEGVTRGNGLMTDRLRPGDDAFKSGSTDFAAGCGWKISSDLWDEKALADGLSFGEMNRFQYVLWKLRTMPSKWRELTEGWPE